MLQKPRANIDEYNKIVSKRLAGNSKCKDNYERYLNMLKRGYEGYCGHLPIKIDYEVSNHCNYRCTMCLMSEIGNNRPENMSLKDFKESIDMQYGVIEVKLQGLGEPLLNPDFFKMVDYAVANNIWVRTTTNASLLHLDENYKKIIDAGIGEIQVSIDGAKKDTFESIRRGSDFYQVVDNCKKMNEYAHSKGEQWRTSCWMLVQKENINEVEDILELAAEMKFTRLTYSIAISDWGKENWAEINNKKEVSGLFTDEFAEKLVKRGIELGITVTFWDGKDKYVYDERRDKICSWIFSRAFISSDTRIVPCCVISDSNTCDMGNAHSFISEWNSKKYQEFRQMHLDGKIPKICLNCYMEMNGQ